ncbi:MAG: carboxypeptidase-like regulatory domain-containing protein, partial [Bacteroidales bacterium]|nr:carboxypeptidase-like regulatory domain-containing protein [Bacteroidales bacterium]
MKNKESGEALIGAHIILKKDRSSGTISNINGEFSISLKPGKYTFLVSYTNMQSDTVIVSIISKKTIYRIIELPEYVAVFDEIEIKTEKFQKRIE